MEVVDRIKEEDTEVMLTTIPDPPETGGVELTRTNKGNPPRNTGIVARKATRGASAGRSAPIRRKPDPDLDKLKNEIGNGRTTTRSRSESEGSRLFRRIGNIPLDFRVF